MGARRFNFWWLLPPVIVALFLLHTTASMVLAGLVALVAGTAVALNYRGAANRVPPVLGMSRISHDGSPASTRKSFGAMAIAGFFIIVCALKQPDLLR